MNITKGECDHDFAVECKLDGEKYWHTDVAADTYIGTIYGKTKKQSESNSKLVSEAFNVTNETGYTPRQLAEQKAELLEALEELKNSVSSYATWNTNGGIHRHKFDKAIKAN